MMLTNKVLTLTIPSYNAEAFLDQAIESIVAAPSIDLVDVIIVNDGSTDATASIAEGYCCQYPNSIRLINKPNGGHGSAVNTGIEHAEGTYFKIVDADDWVDSEALESLVQYLDQCDTDLVLTPFAQIDNTTQDKRVVYQYPSLASGIWSYSELLKETHQLPNMHAITYRTDILRGHITLYEHTFYVDMQYNIFPIHLIDTISYLNQVVYQYRIGFAEQSVSIVSMQQNRDMHKRVILSIIQYLKEYQDKLSDDVGDKINAKIVDLCIMQLNIYLSMGDNRQGLLELRQFIDEMKRYDMHQQLQRHSLRYILLYYTRLVLFKPTAFVFRRYHHINER